MFSKHIRVGPDSAREAVVLNLILQGGSNAVSARLPAAEADDLIAKLATARAVLRVPVAAELSPDVVPALTVVDPAWRASAENLAPQREVEGVSLALRHSGYGWLCFVLPHEEAQALGRWLVENAGREKAGREAKVARETKVRQAEVCD